MFLAIHAVARGIDLARDLKKYRRKPMFYFDSVLCRWDIWTWTCQSIELQHYALLDLWYV